MAVKSQNIFFLIDSKDEKVLESNKAFNIAHALKFLPLPSSHSGVEFLHNKINNFFFNSGSDELH